MDECYLLRSSVHALSATGLECADGRLHVLVQKTSIYTILSSACRISTFEVRCSRTSPLFHIVGTLGRCRF